MQKVFTTQNKKPGMFQSWSSAFRMIAATLIMSVVVIAAGVGLWKGVGRGLSLPQANPVSFHCGCVAAALAITTFIFAAKRFLAYRSWGHWAWMAFFFAGTSAQSFFAIGGV